jgi:protein-tyrosine phosphatase
MGYKIMELIKVANPPLELEGTYNTRELGGYINKDFKTLKKQKLLRSDTLSNLTTDDMEKLYSYGIRTVIDLRRSTEVVEEPSKLQNYKDMKYYNISLSLNDHNGFMQQRKAESLFDLYKGYLTGRQEQVKEIVELISNNLSNGILFNCTAGKDRTGIISMILLKICNVDDETIKMDYEVSESNIIDYLIKRKNDLNRSIKNEPDFLLRSNRSEMEKALYFIEANYGTFNKYMSHLKIPANVLDNIRNSVLEE